MNDFLFENMLNNQGFRLKAIDVFNWGTFDSSSGVIHPMEMDGNTALLVGMNGSGKSTLVDAVLTLLVRPGVRNYNLASGAAKRERDERSYIKGAYRRSSGDEDSYARTQYLRENGNHYTVILGAFENQSTGKSFTALQILYLNGESKVKKIFGFHRQLFRLEQLLNGQQNPSELKQSLKLKGFEVSDKYKVYHEYFVQTTDMLPKAMDMFNQTVSVKDINSLNDFIRKHMLEKVNWEDKLNAMFGHFKDLNKAHSSLLIIRKQAEMLSPLVKSGRRYLNHKKELGKTQAIQEASGAYFSEKTLEFLKPSLEKLVIDKNSLNDKIETKQKESSDLIEKQRQVRNEIDLAGGERLRQIPHLIENEELKLKNKQTSYKLFHRLLKNAGVSKKIENSSDFEKIQKSCANTINTIEQKLDQLTNSGNDNIINRGMLIKEQQEEKVELDLLLTRKTNLPEYLIDLRRNLCNELRLKENELMFAAELISVRTNEIRWLPSIEKVLRSFGMNLLVREEMYHTVSRYIDRTRLKDNRGRGQRLSYLRIKANELNFTKNGPLPVSESIINKLHFKPNHSLSLWVHNTILQKFNFHCCNSIEDFQSAKGYAITVNCHVKRPGGRHEKDNRDSIIDPRHFILGWDNKEKCRFLRKSIDSRKVAIEKLDKLVRRNEAEKASLSNQKRAWQEIALCEKFSDIEYWSHESEIHSLNREKEQLENSNEKVKFLKSELDRLISEQKNIESQRDKAISRLSLIKDRIRTIKKEIKDASSALLDRENLGLLNDDKEIFGEIDKYFLEVPLSIDNLKEQQVGFQKKLHESERSLRLKLEPLQNKLTEHMGKFLREFKDFGDRFAATPDYFEDFEQLQKDILEEGLPEHEKRFKERLNENVTREIALFNSKLNEQQDSIREKIELLNNSLKKLDYNPGSFMTLELKSINDPEIHDFRQKLKDCIEGHFKDSAEDNEARFVRIAKLVKRLEEENRWREKVVDVRRWFRFIARELDKETGAERNAYEDASGQSGGEKAKLAFTILVAAVAYQYNIDPNDQQCNSFRFIVVDEMFSKVDDHYATYALELFRQFGLQLLIVAPLDPKARITEKFVKNYFHVVKNDNSHSNIYSMTAKEFERIASD